MAGNKDYSYLLTLRAGKDDDLIVAITSLPYGARRTVIVDALRAYLFNNTSLGDIMEELLFIESAVASIRHTGVQIVSTEPEIEVNVEEQLRNSLMEFGL